MQVHWVNVATKKKIEMTMELQTHNDWLMLEYVFPELRARYWGRRSTNWNGRKKKVAELEYISKWP